MSKVIDAKGLICPEPVMLLHAAVRDAKEGEVIEVVATDPSTMKDIANFCEFLGHSLLRSEVTDDENVSEAPLYLFSIKKGA